MWFGQATKFSTGTPGSAPPLSEWVKDARRSDFNEIRSFLFFVMIVYNCYRFCLKTKAPAGMVRLIVHEIVDLLHLLPFLLENKKPLRRWQDLFFS